MLGSYINRCFQCLWWTIENKWEACSLTMLNFGVCNVWSISVKYDHLMEERYCSLSKSSGICSCSVHMNVYLFPNLWSWISLRRSLLLHLLSLYFYTRSPTLLLPLLQWHFTCPLLRTSVNLRIWRHEILATFAWSEPLLLQKYQFISLLTIDHFIHICDPTLVLEVTSYTLMEITWLLEGKFIATSLHKWSLPLSASVAPIGMEPIIVYASSADFLICN